MGHEADIILAVLAGSLVMFILVMVIVIFLVVYKRKLIEQEKMYELTIKNKELELLRAVIDTQESEREKIAHNLHDEVGPLVTALKFHLTKHQKALERNELKTSHLKDEGVLIDRIVDNMRTAARDLSPQFLLKHGLVKALTSFLKEIPGVRTEIKVVGNSSVKLSKRIAINTYRMVLEIINNSLKHGHPTEMDVHLSFSPDLIHLSIAHNGVGISNKEFVEKSDKREGIGLASLRSRAILLNASLDFQVEDRAVVTLKVPYNYGEEN